MKVFPQKALPVIEALTGQGINVSHACRVLGVSRGGYYAWRGRPISKTGLRRIWLAKEIIEIHKQSRGTYGVPRVTAELRFGRGVPIGHNIVRSIMLELGLKGIPNRRPPKGTKMARITSLDLVRRNFHRPAPNQLWLTDITEHPTRVGKVYCCAVLDVFSRRVVGWSIDSTQTSTLVMNALGMATKARHPNGELVIHSDRSSQFASWAFSQKVKEAGLAPSMGSVGPAYDNAMMKSFWGRMQVELLNRKKWKTLIDLANSIHDYIKIFHNTRRRHNALNMLSPTEYEHQHSMTTAA